MTMTTTIIIIIIIIIIIPKVTESWRQKWNVFQSNAVLCVSFN